jgi:predicted XRE-type DNA-binding protein
MVAVTTYVVRAKRWAHGWELHIDGIGVTQSRTLDGAEQMVRDYIETLTDRDVSDATVVVKPDLGGLEAKAADVRKQIEQAQRENREAAAASRALAGELRAAGLSVSDTAAVLGVSRGRVSQLVNGSHKVA